MHASQTLRRLSLTGAHVVAHPGQLHTLRRWLRERRKGPLELRQPWWPYAMVDYVEQRLPQSARVFEYGGGGSSLWLADRGAVLTVVEHDPTWIDHLREVLPPSVELLTVGKSGRGRISSSVDPGFFDDYVAAVDTYRDEVFDLVIVDGRARVDCVKRAMPKVRRGGLLLLDDSDRARYQEARDVLGDWPRYRVRGLKASENVPATTSVWTRPQG